MSDPQLGDVLGGKYEVEGILGRGGMGVVVAARHRDLGQKVAIKCLLPHALAVRDVVERFAREARAAAQIQGEHVARVIDVGRFDDGTPYMVMEHLKGHDLSDELQARGTLPVTEAVRYVLEASEAIAQAHALRIVHRDLKPANLFLAETPGRQPIVKVLDFGISKVVEPNADALTKTASVMGTPFYMSPEQLLSAKNVDERTDIWALGVILYELLAGRPPFVGESVPEIVAGILQNAPVALRSLRPDVPPTLEAVVAKCMQSKSADRYANVALMAFDLATHADAADRDSAAAIARVLGTALPAGFAAADAGPNSLAGSMPTSSTAQAGVAAQSRPPPTATAHNLAVSAKVTASSGSRKPLVFLGIGVAAAAVGVAGIVVVKSASKTTAVGDSPAAIAVSAAAIIPSSAPSSPASPAAAALAPLPETSATPPIDTAPSTRSAIASGPPAVTPPRGARTGGSAAHPSAGVVAAPPAPAPPAPTPPPTPTPAPHPAPTSHNPLDLQLKQ